METACSCSWSERSGALDLVSGRFFEADANVHDNDGVHRDRLARPTVETVACGTDRSCPSSARTRMRTLLRARSRGWEYHLFPISTTKTWRGLGNLRDVALGFSCGQGKRAIQTRTHEIDSCLRCIYTRKRRRKSKRNRFQFVNGTDTFYSTFTRAGRVRTSEYAGCSYGSVHLYPIYPCLTLTVNHTNH